MINPNPALLPGFVLLPWSCMGCKRHPRAPTLLQGTELPEGIWKHVPCQLSPGTEGQAILREGGSAETVKIDIDVQVALQK